MKNNNLIASVALFSELYNSETFKSIPDILAEFIKAAVVVEKKYSVNSTELKDLLKSVYGFDIPESVLRTTLKNRLKEVVTRENDYYHFEKSIDDELIDFQATVTEINKTQDAILEELFSYIEIKKSIKLSDEDKNSVFENFSHFLMDNGFSDKYSEVISGFIISKEHDKSFKTDINSIKEGLILYQGINYTADINQLGSWKEKLTIYLSTEHLFSCVGYNGSIFKEIFDDFKKLVNEINRSNTKIKQTIELKYLDETKEEVDSFFKSAESIKKGYKRLDPSRHAMVKILEGCEDVSDIRAKQVDFYLQLKRKLINHQEYSFDIDNSQYNIVDTSVIEALEKASKEKGKPFDEEYCTQCLRIFTKINTFRRGRNNVPFEKIRHIYVTDNNFAKYLAHNNKVKFGDYDIAFAKDIDYIITKFWFKLKKGFNDKSALPKTFDLVTKAKIVISSHINSSISKSYDELHHKFKNKELTEEQAIELSHAYKEKPNTPELITTDNIDTSLAFLDDDNFIEDYFREKTRRETEFQNTVKEKEELEKQLNAYKKKEEEELKKERERKLADQQKIANEKLEKKRTFFSKMEWKKYRKVCYSDLYYMLFVMLITILPIGIGLFLKLYSPLDNWMNTIGDYKLIIWGFLVLIFLIELFGRSFIFNKEKVKSGWTFLTILTTKYKSFKKSMLEEFIQKYE